MSEDIVKIISSNDFVQIVDEDSSITLTENNSGNSTITLLERPNDSVQLIENNYFINLSEEAQAVELINVESQTQLLTIGTQGPQGPTGASGTGTTVHQALANQSIVNGSAVVLISGRLSLADPTNLAHGKAEIIGMAVSNGNTNDIINYILTGEVNSLTGLDITKLYYVGASGTITPTPPNPTSVAWARILGKPVSSTVFLLEMSRNILFE